VTTPVVTTATNLLAYWTLDEGSGTVANDSSGNTNAGAMIFDYNLDGYGGWIRNGIINGALFFDGEFTQVTVSNSASLNPVNGITVAAWVYDNSGGWYDSERILEKGRTDNQYALFANPSANLEFLLAGVSNGTLVVSPPSSSAWHHLAAMYDGSSLISLYIDGLLVTQQVASGIMPISMDPLAMGNKPGNSNPNLDFFNGDIDDVRIYGSALTPAQIARLYNLDSVGDGIPDWWRMQYFGSGSSTNATSCIACCATCDADGTGQDNLFKYVAGLDPTDPSQVFTLWIAPVAGQPNQETLGYAPLALGRTYTVQSSTNMVGGIYTDLNGVIGPQTNGSQATVTDENAVQAGKFYRVHISLP
jgi:hypothetical protein